MAWKTTKKWRGYGEGISYLQEDDAEYRIDFIQPRDESGYWLLTIREKGRKNGSFLAKNKDLMKLFNHLPCTTGFATDYGFRIKLIRWVSNKILEQKEE